MLPYLNNIGVIAGGVGRHIEDVNPLDVVKTLKVREALISYSSIQGLTCC